MHVAREHSSAAAASAQVRSGARGSSVALGTTADRDTDSCLPRVRDSRFVRGATADAIERGNRSRARGFTLAEIAVTIVIVGIGLLLVLQGLNTAKLTAAHTRNYKLSRDLALVTLGQIESGEFQKDIQNGLTGSYDEQGYPDFTYEVIVGDATFTDKSTTTGQFDSWAPTDAQKDQQDKDKASDQVQQQPFEKVKIRITFPKMAEFPNELVLERWMPWTQVYGDQTDPTKTAAAQDPASSTSSQTGPSSTSNSSGK
jgi:prepilin-type N-terminal cleavage/methylation domain-containing protein